MRKQRRYMYNVGVLLDEATYLWLNSVTKEMKVPKSRFCREMVREKLRAILEEEKDE